MSLIIQYLCITHHLFIFLLNYSTIQHTDVLNATLGINHPGNRRLSAVQWVRGEDTISRGQRDGTEPADNLQGYFFEKFPAHQSNNTSITTLYRRSLKGKYHCNWVPLILGSPHCTVPGYSWWLGWTSCQIATILVVALFSSIIDSSDAGKLDKIYITKDRHVTNLALCASLAGQV